MRIVSGSSNQVAYFVAFSTADHISRVNDLGTFQIAWSLNGSTGTTVHNMTIANANSTKMLGVYKINLLDSTVTSIPAGMDSAELCLDITSSMDTVTRTFEIYRRCVTTGQTLVVNTSGKIADVESILSKVSSIETNTTGMVVKLTSVNTNVDLTLSKLTSVETDVDGVVTKLTSVETDVDAVLTKVTSIDANTTALIVLATSINTHVNAVQAQTTQFTFSTAGIVDANMVRVAGASTTPTNMNTVYDTNFATVYDSTNNTWRGAAASLSTSDHEAIALAVWDEAASSHATAGTFGKHVGDIISKVSSIDTDIDTALTRLSSLGTHVDTLISKVSSIDVDIDTAITNIAAIKTETTAIKAKTDSLNFTVSGKVNANIHYVNDVQVQGVGTTVDTWRPV